MRTTRTCFFPSKTHEECKLHWPYLNNHSTVTPLTLYKPFWLARGEDCSFYANKVELLALYKQGKYLSFWSIWTEWLTCRGREWSIAQLLLYNQDAWDTDPSADSAHTGHLWRTLSLKENRTHPSTALFLQKLYTVCAIIWGISGPLEWLYISFIFYNHPTYR